MYAHKRCLETTFRCIKAICLFYSKTPLPFVWSFAPHSLSPSKLFLLRHHYHNGQHHLLLSLQAFLSLPSSFSLWSFPAQSWPIEDACSVSSDATVYIPHWTSLGEGLWTGTDIFPELGSRLPHTSEKILVVPLKKQWLLIIRWLFVSFRLLLTLDKHLNQL